VAQRWGERPHASTGAQAGGRVGVRAKRRGGAARAGAVRVAQQAGRQVLGRLARREEQRARGAARRAGAGGREEAGGASCGPRRGRVRRAGGAAWRACWRERAREA
jgi:hypothetical protein